jgi:UDP-GlcNAc:undecaprenyl-phosphate GlcNAc-1-phosphate transferase
MGLADDSFNTKPIIKFGVQFICTLLFVWSDNYIKVLPSEWMNYVLTFLWVVGLMNSINMLDNMDAITTVVSIGILTGVLLFSLTTESGDSIYTICSLGVLGSLIGFLYHNWNPSKMFMGDTGSQFLGVFLAWLGIRYFWNSPDAYDHPIQSKQILMAILIFSAPIADTFTVSLNRIKAGKSPFVGGRDHTTHNLIYNGFRERQVALIFLSITLSSVLLCYNFIFYIRDWNMINIIVWSLYFCLIVGGLYYTTMTKKAREKNKK